MRFQTVQRSRKIHDTHDGNPGARASRRHLGGRSHPCRPILRQHHCRRPNSLGRTDDRTQVVGILDVVENHHQVAPFFKNGFQSYIGKRLAKRRNALVLGRRSDFVEPLPGNHPDRYPAIPGDGDQIPNSGPCRFIMPNHFDRTGLRREPGVNHMDAVDATTGTFFVPPAVFKLLAFHYHPRTLRVLTRYVLAEIIVPSLLGLGVFTTILLVARMLKLVELVVNRGVPFLDIVRIFSYIMPTFLEVTVPMAVLLGVLVAFGRLSSDSELVALTASGVSLQQLITPVAIFAFLACSIALVVSFYARPWGNSHFRSSLYEIAKKRAAAAIKEKVFTDEFDGLVIYVDQVAEQGTVLKGILISDTRDSSQRNTIFARIGYVIPAKNDQGLSLRLVDGSLHTSYERDRSYHRTDFSTYDITLDLGTALARLSPRERDPNELTVSELRSEIQQKRQSGDPALAERVELHRKFSIPFASLIFAIVGVPLGIRPTRAVRSRGFAMSLVLIFFYYLLLTLGESLGLRGIVPPSLALWLPNIVFTPIAVALFWQASTGGGFVTSNPFWFFSRLRSLFRPNLPAT